MGHSRGNKIIVFAGSLCRAQAGAGNREVEYLGNCRPHDALEYIVSARGILTSDPALLISGSATGDVHVFSRNEVLLPYTVPGSENIWITGLHPFVNNDCPVWSDL